MAKSKTAAFQEQLRHREVTEIFAMFRVLKRCYDALEDKTGINPKFVLFDGFDGNNEPDYLKTAQQIACGDQNARAYDSHMRRLPWYRTLMQRWQSSRDPQALTRDDLVRITAPMGQE